MKPAWIWLVATALANWCCRMALSNEPMSKMGGLDVLVVVMEYVWNGGKDAKDWKKNVTACLDWAFEFGPADNQSRLGVACGNAFGDSGKGGYDVKLADGTRPADIDYGKVCTAARGSDSLQQVLNAGAVKIGDKRANASLVTFVFSDGNLKDTTLSKQAEEFFNKDNNILFIVYRVPDGQWSSWDTTNRLAANRDSRRVVPFLFYRYACIGFDYKIQLIQQAVCISLKRQDVLSKSACGPSFEHPNTSCDQRIIYKSQVLRADKVCVTLDNLDIAWEITCTCPNFTTPATSAATTNGTTWTTTAAETGLSCVAVKIIVAVVSGAFGAAWIGLTAYLVCCRKSGGKKRLEDREDKKTTVVAPVEGSKVVAQSEVAPSVKAGTTATTLASKTGTLAKTRRRAPSSKVAPSTTLKQSRIDPSRTDAKTRRSTSPVAGSKMSPSSKAVTKMSPSYKTGSKKVSKVRSKSPISKQSAKVSGYKGSKMAASKLVAVKSPRSKVKRGKSVSQAKSKMSQAKSKMSKLGQSKHKKSNAPKKNKK